MSINTPTMIDEVYAHCGIDEDDMPRSTVLLQLNKAFWELMGKFKFRENMISGNFTLAPDQVRYAMPTLWESIRSLSVVNPTTNQSSVVNQTNEHYYDSVLNINNAQQFGIPTLYWRENNELVIWPNPDQAYVMTVRYLVTLDDLTDDSSDFPPIPQEWHEIIMLGGVWRTFALLGDKIQGDNWHNTQIGLINSTVPVEAKELGDTKLSRVQTIRPYYNPRRSTFTGRWHGGGFGPDTL